MKWNVRTVGILIALTIAVGLKLVFAQPPDLKQTVPEELKNTLEHAEIFTLFSLDPEPNLEAKSETTFKGYPQLGKIQIPAGQERTNLLIALFDGITNAGWGAWCFNPRHGIRAEQGSNSIELVICFECGHIQCSLNNGTNFMLRTTQMPTETFNGVLRKAKVPLSKK